MSCYPYFFSSDYRYLRLIFSQKMRANGNDVQSPSKTWAKFVNSGRSCNGTE